MRLATPTFASQYAPATSHANAMSLDEKSGLLCWAPDTGLLFVPAQLLLLDNARNFSAWRPLHLSQLLCGR
eukprot:SAG11_NODE_28649_length_319_cov_0.940909_1_plen_70_part_01